MLAARPWAEWVADNCRSHTHPLNRRLHLVGILLILVSLALAPLVALVPALTAPALM